jgi:hypothetical protein
MGAWRCYLADPLCWSGIAVYLLNRLFLRMGYLHGNAFFRGHLCDLLLLPCALPPLLFVYRCLGLRVHDRPPTWLEIGLHLTGWSLFFEWIGPVYLHRGTADLWDVVAYTTGAGIAGLVWMRGRRVANAG